MKVDIVVNSMIQQIDRNLQTQLLPPLSFRPGEILRGRVMLGADDRPQIRLDSGTLLDALPAGDVMLTAGSTVTLRVSGRVDGQLVMQLLEQEQAAGQAPAAQDAPAEEALAKYGLNSTPQGRAVIRAMEGMNLPLREGTVRQALDILSAFPDLGAEKAAFIAANRLPATQSQADALNRLVDGATTGEELVKLADILSSQALESENVQIAGNFENSTPTAAAPGQEEVPGEEASITGWEDAALEPPYGGNENELSPVSAEPPAAQAPEMPGGDGALKLQSLVFVALGMEAAERYSEASAALDDAGASGQAAALALDAPFTGDGEFAARLQTLTSALPQEDAAGVRDFIVKLAEGLRSYIRANGPDAPALPRAQAQPDGIPRIVREIADLFVKLSGGEDEPGESLARAAAAQKDKIAHIASEVVKAASAGPDARQQLVRVENHVRLVDDISQYAFRQIPVQMDGRNRTVELYVLNKKGGGKKIKADNANILIALDTDNLGRIEALVGVSGKSLRLRFGVERPALVGYVGSFAADIGEAVQKLGYRLSDMRTEVAERRTTPLTVSKTVGNAEKPSGALDIRL